MVFGRKLPGAKLLPDVPPGDDGVAHNARPARGEGIPRWLSRPRRFQLLHFPSANSAAHRPSARDVAMLGELLDDDVWAFSNCRVDAPGRPVAEVDWLFYNVRHGTMMISEWKGFPQRVLQATDTGMPWVLEDGLQVPNPVEQVSRQLDAVRAVLRSMVLPLHFPAFDPQQLRIMQSVYSPQVDERTGIERIRWGKVYGSLRILPPPSRLGTARRRCSCLTTTPGSAWPRRSARCSAPISLPRCKISCGCPPRPGTPTSCGDQ